MELAYIKALGFENVIAYKYVSDNLDLQEYREKFNEKWCPYSEGWTSSAGHCDVHWWGLSLYLCGPSQQHQQLPENPGQWKSQEDDHQGNRETDGCGWQGHRHYDGCPGSWISQFLVWELHRGGCSGRCIQELVLWGR